MLVSELLNKKIKGTRQKTQPKHRMYAPFCSPRQAQSRNNFGDLQDIHGMFFVFLLFIFCLFSCGLEELFFLCCKNAL